MANHYFKPKNEDIERLLNNLLREPAIVCDSKIARHFGNYKYVKNNRDNIYIGRDYRNRKSVIKLNGKLKKKGEKFCFL